MKLYVHKKNGKVIPEKKAKNIDPEHLAQFFSEIDAEDDVATNADLYEYDGGQFKPKKDAELTLAVREMQEILVKEGHTLKHILKP